MSVRTMKKIARIFSPLLGVTVSVLLLAGAPWAHAVGTLVISDGSSTIVVTDGSGSDANSNPNVVQFTGVLGIWNITAVGSTGIGAGAPNELTLGASETSSSGPGTLKLFYSDINFSLSGTVSYTNSFGGTAGTGRSLSPTTWWDASNLVTNETTQLTSQGPFTTASFNQTVSGNTSVTSPFSLTIETDITHSTASFSSFSDTLVLVPEPGTWALCALGLTGLFVQVRARRRK